MKMFMNLCVTIALALSIALPASAGITVERWSYQSAPSTWTAALRVCDGMVCTIEKPGERIALSEKAAKAWVEAQFTQKASLIYKNSQDYEPFDVDGDGTIAVGEVREIGPDTVW
jgi:hypothetical protein